MKKEQGQEHQNGRKYDPDKERVSHAWEDEEMGQLMGKGMKGERRVVRVFQAVQRKLRGMHETFLGTFYGLWLFREFRVWKPDRVLPAGNW